MSTQLKKPPKPTQMQNNFNQTTDFRTELSCSQSQITYNHTKSDHKEWPGIPFYWTSYSVSHNTNNNNCTDLSGPVWRLLLHSKYQVQMMNYGCNLSSNVSNTETTGCPKKVPFWIFSHFVTSTEFLKIGGFEENCSETRLKGQGTWPPSKRPNIQKGSFFRPPCTRFSKWAAEAHRCQLLGKHMCQS